jgi:hypothetical protein
MMRLWMLIFVLLASAVVTVLTYQDNYYSHLSIFTKAQESSVIDKESSSYLSLSGRISSMLMPVGSLSPAIENQSSSIIMPDLTNRNDTMIQQQQENENSSSRMEAMEFSMAQDITWLLSGDWYFSTNLNGDNMTTFNASFTKITTDGTMKHFHKITNFVPSLPSYSSIGSNITNITGTADIYFNNERAWPQVMTNLYLANGEALKIDINSEGIDNHFHGQPIYGVVTQNR